MFELIDFVELLYGDTTSGQSALFIAIYSIKSRRNKSNIGRQLQTDKIYTAPSQICQNISFGAILLRICFYERFDDFSQTTFLMMYWVPQKKTAGFAYTM